MAIISIAVNYMIISALENMNFIGGSRGFQGMKDTYWAMIDIFDGPWMLFWVINFTIFTVWVTGALSAPPTAKASTPSARMKSPPRS